LEVSPAIGKLDVFGKPGREMMLVGSTAVLLDVFVSPPPLTVAVLMTELGAL
jgi:hypothetical protein